MANKLQTHPKLMTVVEMPFWMSMHWCGAALLLRNRRKEEGVHSEHHHAFYGLIN